jgi:hypothetical protein
VLQFSMVFQNPTYYISRSCFMSAGEAPGRDGMYFPESETIIPIRGKEILRIIVSCWNKKIFLLAR